MAVSRPFLLALIGAVLTFATFLAAISAREAGDDPAAAAPAPAPAAPAAAKAEAKPEAKADAKSEARADSKPEAKAIVAQAPAKPAPAPARPAGVPGPVLKALESRRTVVLFFFQPGAADDAATSRAVEGLRGTRGVQVFRAPIAKLSRYRDITSDIGVTQAPAVVIANRRGARLVEGYVDPKTLAQEVADSR